MWKFPGKKLGDGDLVSVNLQCMTCEAEMTISVSRERGLPKTLYWECTECQKVAGKEYGRKRDAAKGKRPPP